MKLPKLTAVIEPGEDGWYVANCPELGIVSQGETPEHAEEMIKEAMELWLAHGRIARGIALRSGVSCREEAKEFIHQN